jgi:hypothetical protein
VTVQVLRGSGAVIDRDVYEKAGVTFLNVQMFSLIYLEKFAVGPLSFQLSLTMLIMFASMIWMIICNKIKFDPRKVCLFLFFVGLSLMSQIISASNGSIPSLVNLAILYSFFTVTINLSQAAYLRCLRTFIKLMVLPAAIIIVQYTYQIVTRQTDPIDMNHLLPPSILMQGFFYDAHYPWNSFFARPNGFFFLEPSFASAFAASAAVIEITYFRRPLIIALMLLGTFLSLGATGTTMLIVASPVLLAYERPGVIATVIVLVIAALLTVYIFDLPIPILSRLNELNDAKSSGAGRLLEPATVLLSLLSDPSFFLTGTGAGSSKALAGSIWPIVKLLQEYGLISMTSFVIFYLCCIFGNFNLPLKVALSIVYHFTGGYLLNPVMVELIAITCVIAVPIRKDRGPKHEVNRTAYSTDPAATGEALAFGGSLRA